MRRIGMKGLLTTILILLLVTVPVYADDLQDAADAYRRSEYKTAWDKFKWLAEQGNAEAQFYFGTMHFDKGDFRGAARWFLDSAKQGFALSQFMLSVQYMGGEGVQEDPKEALRLLMRAAEQGHALAHITLGIIYKNGGVGVEKDYVLAHKWFSLAVTSERSINKLLTTNQMNKFKEDEIKRSLEEIAGIEKNMSSIQIAKALKLAKEWIKRSNKNGMVEVEPKCSDLLWSSNPGAYEMQLKRRCNNPYFSISKQVVSEEDLVEAIRIDNDDYELAKEMLLDLEREMDGLGSIGKSGDAIKIRERLEEIISFSMGVGGRAYEIASMAGEVRKVVISELKRIFSNDKDTLSIIEKANTLYKQNNRIFHTPVVAQITRKNGPINREETIATILSEDVQTIYLMKNMFKGEKGGIVVHGALKLLQKGLDSGYTDPEYEKKLLLFKGLLNNQ
jgi:tetratricopeptide (TPR) repeat protein